MLVDIAFGENIRQSLDGLGVLCENVSNPVAARKPFPRIACIAPFEADPATFRAKGCFVDAVVLWLGFGLDLGGVDEVAGGGELGDGLDDCAGILLLPGAEGEGGECGAKRGYRLVRLAWLLAARDDFGIFSRKGDGRLDFPGREMV